MPATYFSKMFKTESCLVASSIHHCKTLTSNSDADATIVLQEVDMGFGIADIVVIEHTSQEHSDVSVFLSSIDVLVYKLIEQEKIAQDDIIMRTRLRKKQVIDSIAKLKELGYVSLDEDGSLMLVTKYASHIHKSIAIEAKLKDWRRALNQAYRYKWFASKSYVLLDRAKIGPAKKNIAEFMKIGVGLLAVDAVCGTMEKIYDPGSTTPLDERMAILLSEKVKELSHNGRMTITN